MLPYYTRILTGVELSVADLIIQTSNLIIPLASVGVANSIIRFGLDQTFDKREVFTGGLMTVLSGYGLFLLLYPLFNLLPFDEQTHRYLYLIYLFVLTSMLRSLCSQFVRARQLVRLYAFDGLLSTVTVILFNVLFLSVFKLGVLGYILATICSDFLSALFLFSVANLRRFIRFSRDTLGTLQSMIRYAIPLIPANLFWWVTNVSDRYILAWLSGHEVNGLYGLANKIPTVLILLSGIFIDAWQMSAFTEHGPGRDRFFTRVFNAYLSLIFTAGAGLILCAKLCTTILIAPAHYEAWRFIPLLVLSACFSCFVTFLGSIYMLEMRSTRTLVTTAVGALLNLLLNFLLIPKFGGNGAAFATFASYLTVFLIRVVDTRKYVRIRWSPARLAVNLTLLLLQTYLLLTVSEFPKWVLYEGLLCLLVVMLNLGQLLASAKKLLSRKQRKASGPALE